MPFACIHVPNFILQAALRVEPGLRSRPAGIVDGTPPLVTVIAKNKNAGLLGLEIGMTKSQAEQISGVQLRRRSIAQETAAHAALMDLALSFSPRIEEAAADTIVLDLEGLAQLFVSFENLAVRLAARAKKFGLSVQVATGSNPEVAQLAARGFSGVTVLSPEEESERLGQLPIAALNPSEEIRDTLERWGVRTCKALAALPSAQLSERLGQEGIRLQELARGTNQRALIPAQTAARFEEAMELDTPVRELEPLAFLLGRLLDQLCGRLSARTLATNEIRLRMQLEPGEEEIFGIADNVSIRKKGPTPSSLPSIYEHALRLPLPMRDSKALLRLWRLHLESHPPVSPIVKIEMTAEPAKTRVAQSGLFTPLSPDPEKLEITMARAGHVVGEANIGAAESVNTNRPFSFRMRRFDPAAAASDDDEAASLAAGPFCLLPATALRVFRPAMPTKVETRERAPVRVFFGGVWGEVRAASGPWRTSGDWWSSDPWNQDEWDLEIEFPAPAIQEPGHFARRAENGVSRGVYRIVRERSSGNWFVRGVFD